MYTSGTWGYVYALDAASGKEIWRYDPKGDWFPARNPCCDLVNRGVAVWKGKVYVASGDGRLHAIDAATGRPVWVVDTIVDHRLPYSSTGAPQIAGNVVVIGNGGSDMGHGGVRGYVSAYDLSSGVFKWRFYTVPPAPGQPLERSGARGGSEDLGCAPRSAIQARRHGLGRLRLRSRLAPGVFRHGERRALRSSAARQFQTRRALHRIDHRAPRRHRPDGVVLPDDAERSLGLRRHAEADLDAAEHRRCRAPRTDAGEQERLLLRARPGERRTALGEALHLRQLGFRQST